MSLVILVAPTLWHIIFAKFVCCLKELDQRSEESRKAYLSFTRVLAQLLSCVQLFVTTRTVAHQAPLFMGFSRQGYWSGLQCPSPGDLPGLGIEPRSPALLADSLPFEPPGKPRKSCFPGGTSVPHRHLRTCILNIMMPLQNFHSRVKV